MNFLSSIAKYFGFISEEKNDHINKDDDNNENSRLVEIPYFIPKLELIYCYFIEENTSDEYILASRNQIFEVYYSSDIQRFCYYPKQKIICTFIGFSSSIELMLGIKSPVLKNVQLIKYYPTRDRIQPFHIRNFLPNKYFIYYFFIEKSVSQKISSEINYVSDIQRFRYFPGTKDVFTFIGFKRSIQIAKKEEIIKSILKLTIDKNKIFIYGKELESQPTENHQNTPNNLNNKDQINQKAKETIVLNYFSPIKNLSYCYFKEITFENYEYLDSCDVQHNRMHPKTQERYTFVGFKNKAKRDQVIEQQLLISNSQNQKVFKFVYADDDSSNNKQKKDNVHSPNIFYPKQNLIYFCFKEKESSFLEMIKNAPDIQRNCFCTKTDSIFNFIGFLTKEEGIQTFQKLDVNLNDIFLFSNSNFNIVTLNNDVIIEDNQPNISKFNFCVSDKSAFKVFVPIDNIFYCYFTEIQSPSALLANKKYSNIFGIKNASDIQRFSFYPKTQLIFTFIGFTNKNKLLQNISKVSLKTSAFNQQIYIFHKNQKVISIKALKEEHNNENTKDKKQDTNRSDQNNESEKKETNQCDQTQTNKQQESQSKEMEIKSNDTHQFNQKKEPEQKETNQYNQSQTNKTAENKQQVKPSNKKQSTKTANKNKDTHQSNQNNKLKKKVKNQNNQIQTNKTAENKQQVKQSNKNQSTKTASKNKDAHQTNQNNEPEKKERNLLNQTQTNEPPTNKQEVKRLNKNQNKKTANKETNYYRQSYTDEQADKKHETKQYNSNQNNEISSKIKETSQLDRFHYNKSTNKHQHSKIINKNSNNMSSHSQRNKSSSESKKSMQFNQNNESANNNKETKQFNLQKQNNESTNIKPKPEYKQVNRISDNSNSLQSPNENDTLFSPNENLYYLYFKEKNLNRKNYICINSQLFGIVNINEIQRGFRRNQNDENYYTFFGFLQSFDRNLAFCTLEKEKTSINIDDIKLMNDDDATDYSDNDIKLMKDDNDDSLNKFRYTPPNYDSKFRYTPQNINMKSTYSSQVLSNQTKTSLKFTDTHSCDKNTNAELNYTIKDKKIKDDQRFHFSYVQNVESNHKDHDKQSQQQPISDISMPKFRSNKKSTFNYNIFVPKDGLVYFFLAENIKPSFHIISKNYTKLFGIKNASDIQRFCYYPGTRCIYTFIGFKDQDNMQQAIQQSSVKSSAIGQAIYNYPYKLPGTQIEQKTNDSNCVSSKDNINNDNINNDNIINDNIINDNNIESEDINKNDDGILDENVTLFCPDEDLYYIYFEEKDKSIKNSRDLIPDLFGVSNLKDSWRGFRISTNDPKLYTFLGFSHSIDLNAAISVLQNQSESIETSSIQKYDQKEYSDDDDDSSDDDEGIFSDNDYDEIGNYSEDVLHHFRKIDKVSPDEIIKFK